MPYPESIKSAFRHVYRGRKEIVSNTILFRGDSGKRQLKMRLGDPLLWFSTNVRYAISYAYWNKKEDPASIYRAVLARNITLCEVQNMRGIGEVFESLKAKSIPGYIGNVQDWQRDNMIALSQEVNGGVIDGIYLPGDENSDDFLLGNHKGLLKDIEFVDFIGEQKMHERMCVEKWRNNC